MRKRIPSLLVLLALGASPALAADPFASDWAASAKSRARLIADGAGGAGIEIELAPGAITYWRDPGDSGLPPSFDFGASRNVAEAEAAYPAPTRIAEPDGSSAIGYLHSVVFPIHVSAKATSQPVILKVVMNYAVCEKICLPARAALTLELPVGVSGPYSEAIAAARRQIPVAMASGDLGTDVTALQPLNWRLCLATDPQGAREAFVEAPSGYWLTAKADGSNGKQECYSVASRDAPAEASGPIAIRVTLVGARRAVETAVTLAAKK